MVVSESPVRCRICQDPGDTNWDCIASGKLEGLGKREEFVVEDLVAELKRKGLIEEVGSEEEPESTVEAPGSPRPTTGSSEGRE